MINIYDNANEMSQALTQTQQYQDLKQAFDMLKLDTVAYGLFTQFQSKQIELQRQNSQGMEISQDALHELQDLGDKIKDIDVIKSLMQSEQQMSMLMEEVNAIVSKPIADLYQPETK